MTASDRPTPRSRPRPAADESTDPMVGPASFAQPLVEVAAIRRGPEPTVQLNVRVGSDISALIDRAQATTGRTKRQLIERAIRQVYS